MRTLIVSVTLLLMSACTIESDDVTRSADGCTIYGETIILDANAYGVSVDDAEHCDIVTVQAQTLVLDVVDGTAYLVGPDMLTPDAAGLIEVDARFYDGVIPTPATTSAGPCNPAIQCCVKPKVKIKFSPTPKF
jgi:hypothetical protein